MKNWIKKLWAKDRKPSPDFNIRLYNEIVKVMNRYRKELRIRESVGHGEQDFRYKETELPPGKAFGLVMWVNTPDGNRLWENLVLDSPEFIIKTYADRLQQTIKIYIDNAPDKKEALGIIAKALGGSTGMGIIEVDHICPVHGKECPDEMPTLKVKGIPIV